MSENKQEKLLKQVLRKLDTIDAKCNKMDARLKNMDLVVKEVLLAQMCSLSTPQKRRRDGEQDREGKKKVKKERKSSPVSDSRSLPKELFIKVANHVHNSEALALSLTCRGFRDAMKEVLKAREGENSETKGKLLTTRCLDYGYCGYDWIEWWDIWDDFDSIPVSEDWIKWAFSMKWEYAKDYYNEENKKEFLVCLAARVGLKDGLCWLKSQGCKLDDEAYENGACEYAAGGGNLEVLKYLKSEGVKFNATACKYAAQRGNLEVLKYLKSEGVKFDEWTCYYAARRGRLAVLKWLRSEEVNCPWDIQECYESAPFDSDVRKWIQPFLPS